MRARLLKAAMVLACLAAVPAAQAGGHRAAPPDILSSGVPSPGVLSRRVDAAVEPEPTYVSMGSSYASGLGLAPRDPAGGGCWRSLGNYAHLVAAHDHLRLVDVACSGATTENILAHPQAGFPPQIGAVGAGTRLVTITVGGNNIDYMGNLLGYSCRDTHGIRCAVAPDAEVAARLAELPGDLGAVVRAVRGRAPGALVVLVGYLPVLPEAGTACAAAPLDAADLHRMQDLYGRLNGIIAAIAARTGAMLVPSPMLGEGHDACSAAPFVASYHPAPDGAGATYHPNQAGMDRVAQAIEAAIGRRLAPPAALTMTEAPAAPRPERAGPAAPQAAVHHA